MKIIIPNDFEKNVAEFDKYLKKFNKIHNLTRYSNINEVVKDSIEGIKFLNEVPKIAIDVGSGAGFPSIFLVMILKDTIWHLYEPNLKKASFLTYAKINLNLKNIIVHSEKIENSKNFKADLITSRALMPADKLIEICKGYFNIDTKFLLYKGSSFKDEIKNLNAEVFNYGNRNYILISDVQC